MACTFVVSVCAAALQLLKLFQIRCARFSDKIHTCCKSNKTAVRSRDLSQFVIDSINLETTGLANFFYPYS